MALIKEIQYEHGDIKIWDDAAKKEPQSIQGTIDRVSKIILNYYRRNTA